MSTAPELGIAARVFAAIVDCPVPYEGPFAPPHDLELSGAGLAFDKDQREPRLTFRFSKQSSVVTVQVHYSYVETVLDAVREDAGLDSDAPLDSNVLDDAASLLTSWVDGELNGPPTSGERTVHLR
jgi:hypothetical protein